MKTSEKKPLSMYIHIPFCMKKCLYCDFLSAPATRQERESYVEALLREMEEMAPFCREYEVNTVFFGGGTPSLLRDVQMERIMQTVKNHYNVGKEAEISMECNPATASLETLKAYRRSGINRLSIGLQSAQDEELKALGRIHDYAQFLHTYEEAKAAGFTNINIDLMAALPGQTLASYEDTLQKIIALNPTHISAYSLIVEEGTPFYEKYGKEGASKKGELPDEDTEREMYYRTEKRLQEAGYERYEISNYAKKGFECRHNLTYWTGGDYIGFGIGAASFFKEYRYKNISEIKTYEQFMQLAPEEMHKQLLQKESRGTASFMPQFFGWHEEIQQISEKESMEEFMFLGLRLKRGVSKQEFLNKYGRGMEEVYPVVLEKLKNEGLLLQVDDRIRLSEKGTDLANYVMAEFLLD